VKEEGGRWWSPGRRKRFLTEGSEGRRRRGTAVGFPDGDLAQTPKHFRALIVPSLQGVMTNWNYILKNLLFLFTDMRITNIIRLALKPIIIWTTVNALMDS
jgi:hypothetical protein